FGSRLETYLPPGTEIRVEIGQRACAGTTVLGSFQ
ncbi:MAG TPA: phosphatidylserine decarboxylase family protein, partial [Candidatus Hydrogenedentes bacterium]|nr:phosphatidylserine decarboxylase family protein [Candidatus Hydrogenedentota bacterium]